MTTLATQRVTQTGLHPSYTAAAASQKLKPGLRTFIHVKNGDSSSHTVTINDPTSISPPGAVAFNPDVTVAVPAGEDRLIPVPPRFGDPADSGLAALTWSATTSMSVAVVTL